MLENFKIEFPKAELELKKGDKVDSCLVMDNSSARSTVCMSRFVTMVTEEKGVDSIKLSDVKKTEVSIYLIFLL